MNTVDCTNPNGGRLPENPDMMLSDFAGGASGFPMTFYGGKYTGKCFLNNITFVLRFVIAFKMLLSHVIFSNTLPNEH